MPRQPAVLPGRSTTLLPDGRVLLIGGEGESGPVADASIRNRLTTSVTPIPQGLQHARAWHTATVLPDGTVLIAGGIGADGQLAQTAELFDPETQAFVPLPDVRLTPRARHTATLLTDGSVLIAGGLTAPGQPASDAELWDFRTGTTEVISAPMLTRRHNHTATLLADGDVLLWGGTDAWETPLSEGETYLARNRAFAGAWSRPVEMDLPALEATIPAQGDSAVPLDAVIALRFSRPLDVASVTGASVALTAGVEPAAAKVVAAEDGRLAFVTPNAPLAPGAAYTLTVDGLTDLSKRPVGYIRLTFTTQTPSVRHLLDAAGTTALGAGATRAFGNQIQRLRSTGAVRNMDICYTPPPPGPPPGDPRSKAGEPVSLRTGAFAYTKTDLVVPDVLPIDLTHTYNSADSLSREMGRGTTHFYELKLWSAQLYSQADLVMPDGGRIHYVRTSPGSGQDGAVFEHTASPTRFYKSQLAYIGDSKWTVTLTNGTVYVFANGSGLMAIRDRNGNQLTFSRDGDGPIKRITSPNGRWMEFTYDASSRMTQARDNSGRTVSYAYDASGRLWRVTDVNGGITEYTYDANHRMLTIEDPREIVYLTNQYNAQGRVSQQTQADSGTFQFAVPIPKV
jgi:YD repeat-containing protein